MLVRLIGAALMSAAFTVPANAMPIAPSQPLGVDGTGLVITVAEKKKKKKPIQRNPRNGDILIGPVEGFRKPDFSNARKAREGSDLGGLIGQAVNNFMLGRITSGGGSHNRTTGPNEVPMGNYGKSCGPQYWTSTPSSPAC